MARWVIAHRYPMEMRGFADLKLDDIVAMMGDITTGKKEKTFKVYGTLLRKVNIQGRRGFLNDYFIALPDADTWISSILRYLNRRRVKRRTNEAMWELDRHLFAEIRVGRLDVRILRILVEKGGISEEEARNLLSGKTLTPTGAFCSDPHQPPPEKDPDHRTGAPCGTLECADCFRAYFFQDSLVPLAQQIIGLRSLRESMPLIDWFESDFPDDLEFHEMVMGRYPPKQVDAAFEQASLNNAPLLHFRPSRRQV